MHFKKVIVTGVAAALLVGSTLNVSAAEPSTSNYVKELKKSGKENLIIDVEAYKAAYSDLAAVFGDNEYAYIEHYLTVGVFEGRTKGVLFDPLAYAAAYSDVGAAFGNDISAIVDHYINFGAAENRTYGTANGYADIAAAQRGGSPRVTVQRSIYNTNAITGNNGAGAALTANDYNAVVSNNGEGIALTANNYNTVAGNNGAVTAVNANNYNVVTGNNEAGTAVTSNNYIEAAGNGGGNTAGSVNSNITAGSNNPGTETVADTNINSNPSADSGSINNAPSYSHTTSIYEDNEHKTLLRVEYYDDNNKLYEYSDVVYNDKDTNSYTETVYRYDEESKEEVVSRTDTYVNGELVSSEKISSYE